MTIFKEMQRPLSDARQLINNKRTFNQVEVMLFSIIERLYKNIEDPIVFELDEHSDLATRRIHQLRIESEELFNRLFNSAIDMVKLIFINYKSQNISFEIINITEPFSRVLQYLYPDRFNPNEFLEELRNIPFYETVKQMVNIFILTAAEIYCTRLHYQSIKIALSIL